MLQIVSKIGRNTFVEAAGISHFSENLRKVFFSILCRETEIGGIFFFHFEKFQNLFIRVFPIFSGMKNSFNRKPFSLCSIFRRIPER